MKSSYALRHYGVLIQALVRVSEPLYCVEFGILEGYSTVAIGHALKKVGKGHLYAYDLFENYVYSGAIFDKTTELIDRYGLKDVITLKKKNLFDATEDFEDASIDFMHIDISNTGDVIRESIEQFDRKIKPGGLLLFEGGSPARDEVYWMNYYKKEKLFPEIKSNKILHENYTFTIIHPYPSMLICSKNLSSNDQGLAALNYSAHGHNNLSGHISEEELFQEMLK